MKNSEATLKHFYQQLGQLFYSLASIDKKVNKTEIIRLKQIINQEWLPLENTLDEFSSDAAFQIEIVFDWLVDNNWNTKDAIPEFVEFKKEHESVFTNTIIELILKTSREIASSFNNINKLEQVFINQLDGILTNSTN